MFTLKKSLLFLFFIGIVSSSPYRGKRENGEEAEIEDIKRAKAWGIPPHVIPQIVPVRIRPLCGNV
uniref:Pleurain-E antimicrobial peptide n=1 Tax=Nidirana pleuraden TaxID=369511 RepID=B5L1I5_NIDPL|nr:pleurain-E antimicrobial peptide precursor [Nidirana pleuraden]ABX58920.1 pleurain-E antimicrobial peptide precursor [Nidirana pleuraden]